MTTPNQPGPKAANESALARVALITTVTALLVAVLAFLYATLVDETKTNASSDVAKEIVARAEAPGGKYDPHVVLVAPDGDEFPADNQGRVPLPLERSGQCFDIRDRVSGDRLHDWTFVPTPGRPVRIEVRR